jgi:hypothetical protein
VTVALDQLGAAIGASAGNVNTGLRPEQLIPYFIGRTGSASELAALHDYVGTQPVNSVGGDGDVNHHAELVALVLASPAFQRC